MMLFTDYINNAIIKVLIYNAMHIHISGKLWPSFLSDFMYLNRIIVHINIALSLYIFIFPE
jgi:hypothetical protein